MSNQITIEALLAKIQIEMNLALEAYNQKKISKSEILDIQESLLRIQNFKEKKVDVLVDKIKQEEAEKVSEGEVFEIGLRKFVKERAFGKSTLDETKLSQLIEDEDLLDLLYKKQPKTQKEIQTILNENGYNIDIKQLYNREVKNEFKIKPKN